jgi:hypothetical protein
MAYLIAVCGWILLTIGIGAVAFVLLTRRSTAVLALGAALAAVVLEPWVRGFVSPLTAPPPGSAGAFVAMWLPSLLLGAAIGWAGIWLPRRAPTPVKFLTTDPASPGTPTTPARVVSVGRIVSAIAALVILWVGTSVLTGVVSAANSRALLRLPDELAQLITSVTSTELRGDALAVTVAAAVLGAVAVLGHEVIARAIHPTVIGSRSVDQP